MPNQIVKRTLFPAKMVKIYAHFRPESSNITQKYSFALVITLRWATFLHLNYEFNCVGSFLV